MEAEPIRDPKHVVTMRLILRASKNGPRDDALFTLGINAGLRIGDLLALKAGDAVDPKGRIKDWLELIEQKTGKRRKCPIAKVAKEALKAYADSRAPGGKIPPGEALFLSSQRDGPITRQQAHRIIAGAGKAANLKNIGTHSLRKTFGYHVYKKTGGNLGLIQKLLNHSSTATTLRYIGITQEEMDDAVLALNLG